MVQVEAEGYDEQAAMGDDELGGLPANIAADGGERPRGWEQYFQRNLRKMNPEQKHAFLAVKNALQGYRAKEPCQKLFFLEGAGGTGSCKTFRTSHSYPHFRQVVRVQHAHRMVPS